MDTYRRRIGHVSVSDTYRIRDTLLPRRIEVTQMDGEEGRKRMEEGKGRESPLRPSRFASIFLKSVISTATLRHCFS